MRNIFSVEKENPRPDKTELDGKWRTENCLEHVEYVLMNAASIELQGQQVASDLMPSRSIVGDDEQDTFLLRTMADDAKRYISSFSWCEEVLDSYFGGGVGGIFAVFFFHICPGPNVEPWIWIIVGDIPPAYLPLSDCRTPSDVFSTYINGMSNWVELARKGQTGTQEQGVPPVNVPATPEWAERLSQKLHGLTLAVKPLFQGESNADSVQ
jgi:hypothetical protein